MVFRVGYREWAGYHTGGRAQRPGALHHRGDTIRADYQFDNNIQCRWSSVKGTGTWNQNYKHKDKTTTKWGFDIYGSKRLLSHLEGVGTFVLDCPFFVIGDPELKWTPIETIGSVSKPEFLSHPIRNLIHAIETDSKPQCSGEDARWAVEMVCATYLSQQCKGRVPFPLEMRDHPLKDFKG